MKLALKKLQKRNEVTKLKGLEELRNIIESEEEEICMKLLPFWGKILSRLMIDTDARVREAVHQCHMKLVKRLRKRMVPHLRSIIPAWIRSFFIPLRKGPIPRETFEELFAPEKRADVIVFAKKDIMDTIYEALFEQTMERLSHHDACLQQEEREWRYGQYVASALYTLAYIIEILGGTSTIIVECQERFMQDERFWELGLSKISEIRQAYYVVLSTILQLDEMKLPTDLVKRMVKTILTKSWSIETDLRNMDILWSCTQNLMNRYRAEINKENQEKFYQHVISFMKAGCRGSGQKSYQNLLEICLVFVEWESRWIEKLLFAWWEGLLYLTTIDRTSLQVGITYYMQLLVTLEMRTDLSHSLMDVMKKHVKTVFYVYTALEVGYHFKYN
jgi:hypothetical protein